MIRNVVITSSPEILGGEPVFKGTRVPVKTLMDYLESGEGLDSFLKDYPTVTREQARKAIAIAREALADEDSPR